MENHAAANPLAPQAKPRLREQLELLALVDYLDRGDGSEVLDRLKR